MKTSTVIIVAAAAVAAFILLRPKAVEAPKKGAADVLAGAFSFGSSVVDKFGDDDEDSR